MMMIIMAGCVIKAAGQDEGVTEVPDAEEEDTKFRIRTRQKFPSTQDWMWHFPTTLTALTCWKITGLKDASIAPMVRQVRPAASKEGLLYGRSRALRSRRSVERVQHDL